MTVQVLGLFVVFAALITPGLWQRAGLGSFPATALGVAAAGTGLAVSWWLDAPSGVLVALLLALTGGAATIPALRRIAAGGEGVQPRAPQRMP